MRTVKRNGMLCMLLAPTSLQRIRRKRTTAGRSLYVCSAHRREVKPAAIFPPLQVVCRANELKRGKKNGGSQTSKHISTLLPLGERSILSFPPPPFPSLPFLLLIPRCSAKTTASKTRQNSFARMSLSFFFFSFSGGVFVAVSAEVCKQLGDIKKKKSSFFLLLLLFVRRALLPFACLYNNDKQRDVLKSHRTTTVAGLGFLFLCSQIKNCVFGASTSHSDN